MTAAGPAYGVYVHVPFCRMLCTYCDFVKYRGLDAWFDRYVTALIREAEVRRRAVAGWTPVSLFFGGGTPSVLGAGRLRRLRETLAGVFGVVDRAEFCLEANPEDVDEAFAAGIAAAGFTRVSVGVQTFDDQLLRQLGRLHTGEQAAAALQRLLAAGIPAVGADLIFGLPGQTLADWRRTLAGAIDQGVGHLSCYALTVEEKTPLGRAVARRRITILDDDAAADMYDAAREVLARSGYRHYEVSNWSRPGQEARHNALYWRGDQYVGLGAGAVGYLRGQRWWNFRLVDRYCQAVGETGLAVADGETLTALERSHELILLALRTAEGLDKRRFYREVGRSVEEAVGPALAEAQEAGLIQDDGERLRVPESRWAVLHSVVAGLLTGVPERPAAVGA